MSDKSFTFEDLVALVSNELPIEESKAIEDWAASQQGMAGAINKLQNVIQTMQRDDTETMSAEALQKMFDIFTVTQTATKSPTIIEKLLAKAGSVIAELVFDSRATPAMAGFRRGVSKNYQLAYEGESGRIDMQISPVSRQGQTTCLIRGQVSCKGGTGSTSITFLNHETDEVLSNVLPDEHGQFRMDTLPGLYNIVVKMDNNAGAIIAQEVLIE